MSAPLAPAVPGPGGLGEIRLAAFQGPLDLLLHLVRTEAVDITCIPVAEVARQYDEYLDLLGVPDPEAAGDFLLKVATLAYMKSRRLVPPDPAQDAGASEDPAPPFDAGHGGPGMREAAEHLREREALMELVYARPAGPVEEYAGEIGIEADLYALLRAFEEILRRAGREPEAPLARERMTLVERIHWLMERIQQSRRVSFRSLFEGSSDRVSCILTFLALLEIIRLRLARAYTSHRDQDILILLAEDGAPPPAPGEDSARA
ncbi:MAG: segregation/condensation protein A [Acidobacteria bacterium]|nr:segregation/condensation protein A [Acidobacteriota bacterium]